MKAYFRLIFKIFISLLILIIITFIVSLIAYQIGPQVGDYTLSILSSIFMVIFLGIILQQTSNVMKKDDSLYEWLDRLDGEYSLSNKILGDTTNQKDILKNLTITYNNLIIFSQHNKINLKLLKAYYKALYTENYFDLFTKTFIAFIFGLFATNINNGKLMDLFSNFINREVNINSNVQYLIDFLTIVIIFILAMIYIIRDFSSTRKRLVILQELLDIAIAEK